MEEIEKAKNWNRLFRKQIKKSKFIGIHECRSGYNGKFTLSLDVEKCSKSLLDFVKS
jgi:hypothetical protein